MRIRMLVVLVAGLLMGLGSLVVRAQAGGWTAWLYDPAAGSLTQVAENGAVLDSFTLPMPLGFDRYPNRAAASADASLFAYVVYNSVTYQGMLVVSQRDQQRTAFALPLTLSDTTEFVADASLFNESSTALALGYSLDGGGWGVIVLDLTNGRVTATIRSDTPTVALLGLPGTLGLTPVVRRFAGRTVTFTLAQAGTQDAGQSMGYDWQIDTGDLLANPVYGSLDADTFWLTGEVIFSQADERLANQAALFPLFQANTLQVYDPRSGGRFPFFNLPDAALQTPRFIQNGELILTDSVDVAERYAWLVIRRDGLLVGNVPTVASIDEARGVPDGFIYTTSEYFPGATTLVYVNTRDGLDAGVPVWTSSPGSVPVIAWAGGQTAAAQVAYAPWAQLAAPVYAPGQDGTAPASIPGQPVVVNASSVNTGVTPIAPAVLTVGALATVNTTDGDQLNIRLGPGLNYEIAAKLNDGARVTLVEGPLSADGYVWWKIRTASGIVGWAVESVEDNGVRLQTLIPG